MSRFKSLVNRGCSLRGLGELMIVRAVSFACGLVVSSVCPWRLAGCRVIIPQRPLKESMMTKTYTLEKDLRLSYFSLENLENDFCSLVLKRYLLKVQLSVTGRILASGGAESVAMIGGILSRLLAGVWRFLLGRKARRLAGVCADTNERSSNNSLRLRTRARRKRPGATQLRNGFLLVIDSPDQVQCECL